MVKSIAKSGARQGAGENRVSNMGISVLRAGQTGNARLAFALSGGAVWGAAHVGVLRALDEHGIVPDLITGTSVGSVIGAALAAGRTWQELDAFARGLKLTDFARPSLRPRLGILSTDIMHRTLRALGIPDTFDQFRTPFGAVATDVVARAPLTMSTGNVATALRASVAVPLVFEARLRHGRLLVDGGTSANLPLGAAFELGAERVLGIRVLGEWEGPPIAHPIAQHRVAAMERRRSVLVIRPFLDQWSPWDIKAIPQLIEAGYSETMRQLARPAAQAWLQEARPLLPSVVAAPRSRHHITVSQREPQHALVSAVA